jgi:hypothetical protein
MTALPVPGDVPAVIEAVAVTPIVLMSVPIGTARVKVVSASPLVMVASVVRTPATVAVIPQDVEGTTPLVATLRTTFKFIAAVVVKAGNPLQVQEHPSE